MTDQPKFPATENPAETMRKVMEEIGPVKHVTDPGSDAPDRPHLISIPKDKRIEDISPYKIRAAEFFKPLRRRGTAYLQSLDSLIAWADRFKGADSALFADADMTQPTLTCIADYHSAGPATIDPAGDPTARHGLHRATYDFPLSDEWKTWAEISGEPMDKDELGEFIEANAKDFMDPTPAILDGKATDATADWEKRMIQTAAQIEGRFGQLTQLLQISKNFQVHETSNLSVTTNRDTGEAQIQFLNEHKTPDGQPLKIPNLVIIAIPVFRSGAPYRMPVRLRYRKSGASVRFTLTIYNPEKAFEAAFKEAIEDAAEKTGLPLFLGRPEG